MPIGLPTPTSHTKRGSPAAPCSLKLSLGELNDPGAESQRAPALPPLHPLLCRAGVSGRLVTCIMKFKR